MRGWRWLRLALLTALLVGCGGTISDTPTGSTTAGPRTPAPVVQPAGFAGGTVAVSSLPAEALATLTLVRAGGPYPYPQDGSVFGNREGLLPTHPSGYYHEYTVETPNSPDRGARRLVMGMAGERYYTDDHYASFRLVVDGCPGCGVHLRLDPGVHRLRSRATTVDVSAHLSWAGWSVRVADIPTDADKDALLGAFLVGLEAPDWAGRNWDALSDLLRDLSWWEPGTRGRAFLVAGAGHLAAGMDAEWATLCEILDEAAAWWRGTSAPLGVLVRGRALA